MAQNGIGALTMDGLAASLKMSKKTLYKYFASKEELLGQTMLYFMQEEERKIVAIMESPRTWQEKLNDIVWDDLFSKMPIWLLRDARNSCESIVDIKSPCYKNFMTDAIKKILQEGVEAGEVRADLNLDLLIRLMEIIFEELEKIDLIQDQTLEQVQRQIHNFIFHGILVKG